MNALDRARDAAHRAGTKCLVTPLAAMLRQRHGRAALDEGTTIVTVADDDLAALQRFVTAVRRYSPARTDIVVVDNASHAAIAKWARSQLGVRVVHPPIRLPHGAALDLGITSCHTEFVVAVDCSLCPADPRWLDTLIAPLRDGVSASGIAGPADEHGRTRPFLDSRCLALRTERFRLMRHSFAAGPNYGTGQLISLREWPSVELVDPSCLFGRLETVQMSSIRS